MQRNIGRILGAILFISFAPLFGEIRTKQGDFDYIFFGHFKPETFYGRNISLLNNNNLDDKIWFARHTLDLSLDVLYGKEKYNETAAQFLFTVRDKVIWGNPNSIAQTTTSEVKILSTVGQPHRHGLPRNIFWIREAWLWIDLNRMLGLDFENKHSFTIGAFPFELGRGIALGSAYAVGPELLGFYSDSAVDQYAFGGRLSGDVVKDRVRYDVYSAILQNRCSTLQDTAEKVRGQEFGHFLNQARGFGNINFLIAGRINWYVMQHEKYGKLAIEPYAFMNHDPEQRVEFVGDARSKLGTAGFAVEYYGPKFEFGFDFAKNFGQQRVVGWDRNAIVLANRDGHVVEQNSHVVDESGNAILFLGTNAGAQRIIYGAYQDASENGKKIGEASVDGDIVQLINRENRFRNPYTNKYRGWMFVIDAGYWVYKRDVELTFTAGVASGDENPNLVTQDGIFDGFLGIQEIYSGKRVRSAFVLGGAGKLKRPLSIPNPVQQLNSFAEVVNGFTNLVFTGAAIHWSPSNWCKPLLVNPNVLAYWQEKQSNKFDAATGSPLPDKARSYLGLEVNLFVNYNVFDYMELYAVGSIFFPGSHYVDVKGLPLNRDQLARLNRFDRTGFEGDRFPNLGCDAAYTVNFGVNFKF